MNRVSDERSSDPSRRVSGDAPAAARAGCFDCNICLEFAVEPVVTLCGHLYCWPCIYEWLRRDAGGGSAGRPCPVCKAALTVASLVPLYGRGGSRSNKSRLRPAIPCRPTVHRGAVEGQSAQTSGGSGRRHVSTEPDSPTRSSRHAHAGAAQFDILYPPRPLGRGMNAVHPTAGGVLGGMALALLPSGFRGQAPAPGYPMSELQNLSPRLRRQHMEVERSLHQLLFFLFVFVVLCLLLF
ncbi:hypothetical protein D1007_35280 [Hordeum vulgare]|uniref:E3 ubiquitin-protein ligase RMA n=1 Tax=Hordeum vulgare subsp. vulgare TaxID=112509 RepID=A0A287UCS6_HORVV|nr:E3 ubiquitin-protein ligase RMA1H1-like [Hordeum vulgare subsp. vulgare]XP_044955087.1 E3 ubiquitin-protein ligase RMA1H1-like [Hordeum vulgare subsp. vulgare]XP_044955088.1 E3 ubiquitin-protein ligase RMA1H1-like [Hordeum vulgare subsp. vulgare]KAE8790427.1 hypothetical protein D1007_35280 [Hordeum vulgare]